MTQRQLTLGQFEKMTLWWSDVVSFFTDCMLVLKNDTTLCHFSCSKFVVSPVQTRSSFLKRILYKKKVLFSKVLYSFKNGKSFMQTDKI
jgi:hypothetical protein